MKKTVKISKNTNKIKLGILKGKASFKILPGFKISDKQFLNIKA